MAGLAEASGTAVRNLLAGWAEASGAAVRNLLAGCAGGTGAVVRNLLTGSSGVAAMKLSGWAGVAVRNWWCTAEDWSSFS